MTAVAGACLAQEAPPQQQPQPEAPKDTLAETQLQPVLGAQLPSNASWQPLTNKERFTLFWKLDFASPVTVVRPILPTLMMTATRDPGEWPRTWQGVGQRYAVNWVSTAIGDGVEAFGAMPFHQETRFITCRCTGFGPRMKNALIQSVVTYNQEGHWTFAGARLASNFASAAVVVYGLYPSANHRTSDFLTYSGSQIYFTAISNVAREFLPEITRVFRRHHQPKNALVPASTPSN